MDGGCGATPRISRQLASSCRPRAQSARAFFEGTGYAFAQIISLIVAAQHPDRPSGLSAGSELHNWMGTVTADR